MDKLKILYLRNRTWVTWVWHYLTIINLCWRNRWGLQFVHFEFEISRHFLGYPGFLIRGYPPHRGPIFENVSSCQAESRMIGSMMFPQILLCLKDFLAYMTFPWNKVKTVYYKNTEDKNSPKGQLNSKCLFGVFNSSKKRTWKFKFLP